MKKNKNKILYEGLLQKLHQERVFWSYDKTLINNIPDELFIEKVLLHLDIDDIVELFKLYPKRLIRNVWKNKILSLEPMYHGLNRLYAFLFFNIKHPDRYIRENNNKLHARFIKGHN